MEGRHQVNSSNESSQIEGQAESRALGSGEMNPVSIPLPNQVSVAQPPGCHDVTALSRIGHLRLDDVEVMRTRNGQGRPKRKTSKFGVVWVGFRPDRDEGDRLDRIFDLLLELCAPAMGPRG